MSSPFRDEVEAQRARIESLERDLARANRDVQELRAQVRELEPMRAQLESLERARNAMRGEPRGAARGAWLFGGALAAAVVIAAASTTLLARFLAAPPPTPPVPAARVTPRAPVPAPEARETRAPARATLPATGRHEQQGRVDERRGRAPVPIGAECDVVIAWEEGGARGCACSVVCGPEVLIDHEHVGCVAGASSDLVEVAGTDGARGTNVQLDHWRARVWSPVHDWSIEIDLGHDRDEVLDPWH